MTRAKYAISRFRPVQGRVPLRPMPMSRVAASTRVSSSGGGGGILPIVRGIDAFSSGNNPVPFC